MTFFLDTHCYEEGIETRRRSQLLLSATKITQLHRYLQLVKICFINILT